MMMMTTMVNGTSTTSRFPAICAAYELGISVMTMSKPWGVCGITVGWLASRKVALRDKLWNVQLFGTACLSRASEIQAIIIRFDFT